VINKCIPTSPSRLLPARRHHYIPNTIEEFHTRLSLLNGRQIIYLYILLHHHHILRIGGHRKPLWHCLYHVLAGSPIDHKRSRLILQNYKSELRTVEVSLHYRETVSWTRNAKIFNDIVTRFK
jgi:hypothetical protein